METCMWCCSSRIKVESEVQEDAQVVTCNICGCYKLSGSAEMVFQGNSLSMHEKILFSGVLRNHYDSFKEPFLITTNTNIKEIVEPLLQMHVLEKVRNLLRFMGNRSESIGASVAIPAIEYPRFFCKTQQEFNSVFIHLHERGWIRGNQKSGVYHAVLTIPGWEEYERSKVVNLKSKQVFVAMSFDTGLKDIFLNAIEPACKACGYSAERIDISPHNESITNKIVSTIKESRFLIADFTKQSAGVYYEAGFARGFGLPVIHCCRDDDKHNLHFDTKQINHLFWQTPEELKSKLIDWIKATI